MKINLRRISYICVTGIALTASQSYAVMTVGVSNPHDPVLFQAKFGTNQVEHKLFHKSSKNVPHPFYKDYCKNQIPHSYSHANGYGSFLYNEKEHILYYAFSYTGLSGSPIMMHFHLGKAGKGGPIIQTICGHPPPGSKALGYSTSSPLSSKSCPTGSSGFITGHYYLQGNPKLEPRLSKKQEALDLTSSSIYVNIHTCLNEAGELRGQITNSSSSSFF